MVIFILNQLRFEELIIAKARIGMNTGDKELLVEANKHGCHTQLSKRRPGWCRISVRNDVITYKLSQTFPEDEQYIRWKYRNIKSFLFIICRVAIFTLSSIISSPSLLFSLNVLKSMQNDMHLLQSKTGFSIGVEQGEGYFHMLFA